MSDLYPGTLPGKFIALTVAQFPMNDFTVSTSVKQVAFFGSLLVFPCTLVTIPVSLKWTFRVLSFFSATLYLQNRKFAMIKIITNVFFRLN